MSIKIRDKNYSSVVKLCTMHKEEFEKDWAVNKLGILELMKKYKASENTVVIALGVLGYYSPDWTKESVEKAKVRIEKFNARRVKA